MKYPMKTILPQIVITLSVMIFTTTAVSAAMISTEQVRDAVATSVMRDQVKDAFLRDDVIRILQERGVNSQAAISRVDSMSDEELALVHQKIDSLPAGAGPGGVLVTVVLVFVILDILGVTNVFTFIRPQR